MTLTRWRWLLILLAAGSLGGCAPSLQARVRAEPAALGVYIPPGSKDADAIRLQAFERFVTRTLGVSVRYEQPPNDNVVGTYDVSSRTVYVSVGLSPAARFEVLAHEVAHALAPSGLNEVQAQVWADAVSYYVSKVWGFNPSAHIKYLSLHKGGLNVLTDYRVDLNWAISVLVGQPVRIIR